MWVTVELFRERTNISVLENEEIEYFLGLAKKLVAEYCFNRQLHKIQSDGNKQFKITLNNKFLADYISYDGVIDKNDIKVYEVDQTNYVETNLITHVSGFQPKYGFIQFDVDVPSAPDSKIAYIEYYLGRFEWTDMYDKIKLLQILFCLREMLIMKPAAAEAIMSGNVTLNNITFDAGMANKENVYKAMNLQIDRLISELQPMQLYSRGMLKENNPYQFRRF